MVRKTDGLEISKKQEPREGSRAYSLAQLDVGEVHIENRFIDASDVNKDSIAAARKDLNSTYGKVIARVKELGVEISVSTARGMNDDGDVVISYLLKRTA